MNNVQIIGRLTDDPVVRYTQSGTACGSFTVAIDRGKDRDGNDLGADFPRVNCFGKTAENCEKYLHKGSLVAVNGSIRTGSYEKNGQKFYTTDVNASRIEFLEPKSKQENAPANNNVNEGFMNVPADEELPWG